MENIKREVKIRRYKARWRQRETEREREREIDRDRQRETKRDIYTQRER